MAGQAQTFRDWLAAEERLLKSGERGKALDLLDEGARLLGVVRHDDRRDLAEEARLDDDRMERLRRSTGPASVDIDRRGNRLSGHDAGTWLFVS